MPTSIGLNVTLQLFTGGIGTDIGRSCLKPHFPITAQESVDIISHHNLILCEPITLNDWIQLPFRMQGYIIH